MRIIKLVNQNLKIKYPPTINPDAVMTEISDPVSGFSSLYINRPEVIIQLGGFYKLFSPKSQWHA